MSRLLQKRFRPIWELFLKNDLKNENHAYFISKALSMLLQYSMESPTSI